MMKQKRRLVFHGFSAGCGLLEGRKFSARHGLSAVLAFFLVGVLGFAVSLTSCDLFTGDDIEISPPAWIRGEWADPEGNISFTFTDDNIVQNASDVIVNYKTVLKFKPDAFSEMLSNTQEYAFSFTENGASVNYHFVKTSAATLDFYFLGTKLELTMQEKPLMYK